MTSSDCDLDKVLIEIGGFGKYQIKNIFLISLPIVFHAIFSFSYIFTAGDIKYRCSIPICDENVTEYKPDWLQYAVPFQDGVPSKCEHYELVSENCSKYSFDETNVQICTDFIYENQEKTILNEWNLTCPENKWKLALVGTVDTIGQLVCLPIAGYISDTYGRRIVFVFSLVASGIFGLLRSFSWSYISFLAFEFLDPAFGSGVYSAAFILAIELVGPKYRFFGGVIVGNFISIGAVTLGLVAMWTQSWRLILQITYGPVFIFILYLWIIPESVRWLYTTGRNETAKTLKKAIETNKIVLSESALTALSNIEDITKNKSTDPVTSNDKIKESKSKYQILEIFKYPTIMLQLVICSFSWMTNTFVYYGLSLSSVSIGGNKYTSFILVSLIELPAGIICCFIAEKFGRRLTLCLSLISCGVTCFASIFWAHIYWINLILYLIGKFAISISFTTIYVYTTEIFPTNLRHSLLGICSTFGRIGNMIAPQTPLLADVFKSLPMILFGTTAIISGFLGLYLPETVNKKLPDTLDEAVKTRKQKELK